MNHLNMQDYILIEIGTPLFDISINFKQKIPFTAMLFPIPIFHTAVFLFQNCFQSIRRNADSNGYIDNNYFKEQL